MNNELDVFARQKVCIYEAFINRDCAHIASVHLVAFLLSLKSASDDTVDKMFLSVICFARRGGTASHHVCLEFQ